MSDSIMIALIESAGSILAVLIPSLAALYLSRRWFHVKRLEDNYESALRDIQYLLTVESIHCELHKENHGQSWRLKARHIANDQGVSWSQRNTYSLTQKHL